MKRALAAAALLILGLTAHAQTTSQEGDEGLRTLTLRFESSFPVNLPVTGNWQTADGTATAADNDYVPASGTWTIPQGQTQSNIISVQIVGDRKVETDEIFAIVTSNVQNGQPPPPRTVTIVNDDVAAVSVSNVSATEGNIGTRPLTFVVTLTSPSAVPVDVSYFTADGTAVAGLDYQEQEGAVRFEPGVMTQNVVVNVIGDTTFESDETLTLTATPTGGSPATATGTIVNDDARPPSALRIISGNGQQGLLGQPLAQPLVVEVVDETGTPVAGVAVEWTVTRGQASITTATDVDGRARAFVTPRSVGPIDVRASAANLDPVTFTINASTSFESRAHGPVAVPVGRALDTICASGQQDFNGACRALSALSDEELTPALERVAPQQAGAEMKIASEMVGAVTGGVAARLSAVRNGVDRFSVQQLALNVNGRAVPLGMIASSMFQTDAGGTEEPPYSGWSAFVSGNLGTGERDEQDGQLGFDLDSRGLMFGVDRLFGQTIFGTSLNLMQLDADLSGDTGSVDTSGYALTIYGSRSFDAIHLDGAITYGRNTYEAEHFAEAGGMELINATSENDANVLAVTAGAGCDAHRGRTDFDFSLSGTWSRADIDDLTEEGSGPLILFVQGHEVKSLTATAGFNVRAAFEAPFGTILPSLRAEMLHEFEDGARFVTARFIRDSLGTSFTVPLDRVDRNYGRIGAGLQGVFPYGWSAAVEVMQDVLRDDLQFRNIQFTLYKSF
jgi:outer membrane autotransporter protein